MMRKQYHLFVLDAESCPACRKFHQFIYPELEKKFGVNRISVMTISSLSQLNDKKLVKEFKRKATGKDSHPQVFNAKWTPGIGLVTQESWENKNGPLEGFVYGGLLRVTEVNTNNFERDRKNKYPISLKDIIDWIEEKLDQEPFIVQEKTLDYEQKPNIYGDESIITFRHRPITFEAQV